MDFASHHFLLKNIAVKRHAHHRARLLCRGAKTAHHRVSVSGRRRQMRTLRVLLEGCQSCPSNLPTHQCQSFLSTFPFIALLNHLYFPNKESHSHSYGQTHPCLTNSQTLTETCLFLNTNHFSINCRSLPNPCQCPAQ